MIWLLFLLLSLPRTAAALPDLVAEVFDIEVVRNSRVDPGDVIEGCTDAEFGRHLLRFSLRTRNVGSTDLVLGAPGCPDCSLNPGVPCANPLYICGPAHNHPHFASFIEASLLDSSGRRVALGRKVGFCIFDLECGDGKFTCENQGLTAGCADVYGTGLPCQYVDITDSRLPSGQYTLEVKVDPDGVIDEGNENNNITRATVQLIGTQLPTGVTRRNWVPDRGPDSLDRPLGDMWTFVCPPGGSADVSVDTVADRSDGRSQIDPIVFVANSDGTGVTIADDEVDCSIESACGFRCPRLDNVPCGEGGVFSIVVRDHGSFNSACNGGGGYLLNVRVSNSQGEPLSDRDIKLGGGARRRIPRWADPTRALSPAPALDNEGVPF
ncbi:MAG TPA: lysyl oxidase family protein [Terriglobales bacterium]|nr:lysyl oxidase family protein [Terriglobales bacterium]